MGFSFNLLMMKQKENYLIVLINFSGLIKINLRYYFFIYFYI